ncbi:hypothetical protein [Corallococcus sp. AS-1-6]|uniref:hypothetical protein n=1 Tax=Corallococcus sp. AS-1-6 TaxID=2874599 RepID=UPI001CBB1A89|nr:hypothetical protein [Corallococcus sp. AS-1-6]MBZ4371505.1 hypothetical protein [Corallococcus sp. AS-1-6]
MSACKPEEVEQEAKRIEETLTLLPGAYCQHQALAQRRLYRLRDAALEGAKVPGLVADNAALLHAARRVEPHLPHLDAGVIRYSEHAQASGALRAALAVEHPGAALLAEHEAQVSALQAQVDMMVGAIAAGLDYTPTPSMAAERVRGIIADGDAAMQREPDLLAKVATLTAERDGARSREADLELALNHVAGELGFNAPQGVLGTAKDIVDATKRMVSERDAFEAERDALRAQVLAAEGAAYDAVFTIYGDSQRAQQVANAVHAALSAPPAETKETP